MLAKGADSAVKRETLVEMNMRPEIVLEKINLYGEVCVSGSTSR